MSDSSFKLRLMIITALFAAIISVLAQVVIPLPFGVPITGQTLAIGLAATILGSRLGTISTLLYLMIGAVGMPVFAQFTGGLGILIGPTGGFLVGFVPARSEEHTSELQSRGHLVCRLLLEKKNKTT